ncbi:nesprin-2-like [Gastrophryne carolinensis]
MAQFSLKPCLHYPQAYFDTPSEYLPVASEFGNNSRCEMCRTSVSDKVCMEQDRQLCEQFLSSLSRFEDWLQISQIATSIPNLSQTLHRDARLVLKRYEVLLKEMREKLLDLECLNRQYWKISHLPHQILLPAALRRRMQEVNQFWDSLQRESETIHQTLKSKVQEREEFDTDQDDIKLCLTEMDLELSSVEYIYGGNSTEKIQQLKAFQEDVWNNMKRVEGFLERGDKLISETDPQDAVALEDEMTELGSYCQEIFIRLSRLQKRLVSTKLVFEDDILDSGFEHVSSGSSDVFLDLDLEDKAISIPATPPPAKAALPVDLEWDPMGDVGSSGSHDGRDSFYTAASTPWKILSNRPASDSSLSSDSGVTNSKHRSQENLWAVEEDMSDYSVSSHGFMVEGSRRPKRNIHVQTEDTLGVYITLPRTEAEVFEVPSFGSLWIRRLAPLYILFLILLCGSLLIIPLSHPRCSFQRFSWTLMLTYVNGPPPT